MTQQTISAALMPSLRLARRVYRKVSRDGAFVPYEGVRLTATDQEASDLIRLGLIADEALMVGRLGGPELGCVLTYLAMHGNRSGLRRSFEYISGRGGPLWWDEGLVNDLIQAAGFFPRDVSLLERFCVQMLEDMQLVDVLGSWSSREHFVDLYLRDVVRVKLRDLEPYYHGNPWSEVLRGKTVLVVHPFSDSIATQYARRSLLFADPRVLPEFELKTLKAVQSIAENETPFRTWFDAYDSMCDEMSGIEFDVALIGAGAYGFPLAAHAKRIGKKGVHLGGATQILFGIKGKRWDEHPVISQLYNEYWVRPLASERPSNHLRVEDGCYW